MPTQQKEAFVEEFTGKLAEAKGLYLADFVGMDVAQVTALRADLRKQGVEYHVVKNRLLRLACRNSGMEALEPYLLRAPRHSRSRWIVKSSRRAPWWTLQRSTKSPS